MEPEIFSYIRSLGVSEKEMRGTFNMGIGFILIVSPSEYSSVLKHLEESGEAAWKIGSIRKGNQGLCYL
jgi:phosphoribosylformylglycinamidine cyclo-ligase